RVGAGFVNGTYAMCGCGSSGTESCGTTVTPIPDATMYLIVSSDEPSNVLRMPSASAGENCAYSGQTSRTWSRKQWPVPSSNIFSVFSSSALTDLRLASGCDFGTATTNGSS